MSPAGKSDTLSSLHEILGEVLPGGELQVAYFLFKTFSHRGVLNEGLQGLHPTVKVIWGKLDLRTAIGLLN